MIKSFLMLKSFGEENIDIEISHTVELSSTTVIRQMARYVKTGEYTTTHRQPNKFCVQALPDGLGPEPPDDIYRPCLMSGSNIQI